MYNSFITVICVLEHKHELRLLPDYLQNTHAVVRKHFTDFEFIVVNNNPQESADNAIEELPDDLKHNVYLLNLSRATNRNHAILAGLDRSNGDYTVIFDFDFYLQPELILQLFECSRDEAADIVYMRAEQRQAGAHFRPFYSLFYLILRRYSSLQVDEMAHNTRLISRRALNSLLRLRENLRYMKAIYSIVGYRTSYLKTDEPLHGREGESFSERFRTSLIAITSFTTFLRSMLLWIFLFSLVFLIGVIANALKVKFTGVDLFGSAGEPYPGWTFLVILIAVFLPPPA